MFRRRLTGPAAALALAAMSSSIAFAQSELEPARASLAVTHEVPVPGTLKAAYHIRLTSTWPQETIAGCQNGGQETVEGTLTRQTDGTYSGTFSSSTQLLFCGAHGPQGASARGCALTLQGDGRVAMTGVVVDDGSSPSGRAARVEWTPVPGHAAAVSGGLSGGVHAGPPADVSHCPPCRGVSAHDRGRGAAVGYAWSVEVE